jgi:hypothetical protein
VPNNLGVPPRFASPCRQHEALHRRTLVERARSGAMKLNIEAIAKLETGTSRSHVERVSVVAAPVRLQSQMPL